MNNLNKILILGALSTGLSFGAQTQSSFDNILDNLFYYDTQNVDYIETATQDKMQGIKDANRERIRLLIKAELTDKLIGTKINLTPLEQDQLLDKIMAEKVINNNSMISAISNNNRIVVELVNKYFDQYIVNNKKNVFIGQATKDKDYDKFISYEDERAPLLKDDEKRAVFIVPLDLTNTVNIPLKTLRNFTEECDIHFESGYETVSTTNTDTKIFKYKNNRLNWYRLEDTEDAVDNCNTLYGTKGTGIATCKLLNSHGNTYKEKILIPGMAYVYVPFIQEPYTVTNPDGTTSTQYRTVPDTNADIKECPTDTPLTNGNVPNYFAQTVNDATCYHYFDYIKYSITYEIDLLSGVYRIDIKENVNPFDDEVQKFLMPTKLFIGTYGPADVSSRQNLGFGTYDTAGQTISINGTTYPYNSLSGTPTDSVMFFSMADGSTFEYETSTQDFTKVTTETIQDTQQVIHASAASNQPWYTEKFDTVYDLKELESKMKRISRMDGNVLYNPGMEYPALVPATPGGPVNCQDNILKFKLNIKNLVDNLLDESYYKITHNADPDPDTGACQTGWTLDATTKKCIEDACNTDYYDDHNGKCIRKATTSHFGEGKIYDYLSVTTN